MWSHQCMNIGGENPEFGNPVVNWGLQDEKLVREPGKERDGRNEWEGRNGRNEPGKERLGRQSLGGVEECQEKVFFEKQSEQGVSRSKEQTIVRRFLR